MKPFFTIFPIWMISLCGSSKPNMVVVLVDDHAFEAISAYGTYLKDFSKTPT
ncbi:uncharacterized protein METZ01_LOCUS342434, partial [marine metagenome]